MRTWYQLQAAYWGLRWAGYAREEGYNPKMRECARLSAHFAIAALKEEMFGRQGIGI